MHYLLFYEVVADHEKHRQPLRDTQLSLARAARVRGELVLGGALDNPVAGAVLLFRGDSLAPAEAFVAADPYEIHDLLTRWHRRRWITVMGEDRS